MIINFILAFENAGQEATMILCLCESVNDRTIREQIHAGHRTVRAIRQSCGAGTGCGQCVSDLKRLIEHECARSTGCANDMVPLLAAK